VIRMNKLVNTAAFIIGIIFIMAARQKLAFPYEFLSAVYSFGLTGPRGGLYVALLLPWLEMGVGVALIIDVCPGGALAISTGLCAMFVAVQSWALANGLQVSCGCFGNGGVVNYWTLARAVLLLLASGILLYFTTRQHPAPADEQRPPASSPKSTHDENPLLVRES